MKKAMHWIKQKITNLAYFILYLPVYIVYTTLIFCDHAPELLGAILATWANNKIFHAYYKIYAWFSPDASQVRQYQFGCSWLDYLTGKSKDKPKYRSDDTDYDGKFLTMPNCMSRHCRYIETSPIDLIGMQVITRGLASNTKIKKLEFCPGIITYAGMKVLANYLAKNKSIEEISIMGDYDFFIHHDKEKQFSLEDSSIASLTNTLIHSQTLCKLNLSYLMLSKASWLHVIHLLEHNDKIQELILSGNHVGIEIRNNCSSIHIRPPKKLDEEIVIKLTNALLKKQNIQILDLTDCSIDDEGAKIIAKLLTSQSKIKTLNLSNNKITATGLQAIAENLNIPNNLTTIDLSNNKQNDTIGVKAIFNAISQNSTIKNISLSNMEIDGIMPLAAAAISENRILRSLDLSHNKSSNQHDIEPLADALMINTSLEKLNLMATGIDNIALSILTRSIIKLNLKCLDLSKNDLNGPANETTLNIQSLGVALGENKSLRHLGLPNSNITDNINMMFITGSLIRNNTLSSLDLGDNNIENAESLAEFLVSPNSAIKTICAPNCGIDFLRQLLPALATNPQTLRLNILLSRIEKKHLTECIEMIQPIVRYRNQELRSFYYFLAKNKNEELRDNREHTLKHLPVDVCKKIRGFISSPFEIH